MAKCFSSTMTSALVRNANERVYYTVCHNYRITVKAVHMVDNSGSTSRSIISCLGPEIFVQINRILTIHLAPES